MGKLYLRIEDLLIERPSEVRNPKPFYHELLSGTTKISRLYEGFARQLKHTPLPNIFLEEIRPSGKEIIWIREAKMPELQGWFYYHGTDFGFHNFCVHGTLIFRNGKGRGFTLGGGNYMGNRGQLKLGISDSIEKLGISDSIDIGFPESSRRYKITLVDRITPS